MGPITQSITQGTKHLITNASPIQGGIWTLSWEEGTANQGSERDRGRQRPPHSLASLRGFLYPWQGARGIQGG